MTWLQWLATHWPSVLLGFLTFCGVIVALLTALGDKAERESYR